MLSVGSKRKKFVKTFATMISNIDTEHKFINLCRVLFAFDIKKKTINSNKIELSLQFIKRSNRNKNKLLIFMRIPFILMYVLVLKLFRIITQTHKKRKKNEKASTIKKILTSEMSQNKKMLK